jgi:hypothetical protein
LKIPSGVEIGLSGNGADKKEITAFISNGALPLDGNNLKLLGLNDNSGEWEMFGTKLKINFGKSFVFKDGLQLAGSVSFADYPVIGNKTFFINKFKINAGGDVQFDVACNLNEQIDFSLWKLRLGNIQVNNFGVTASGAVDLSIPETDKVSVAFNNLSFSKSGISGGSFNIYSEAIASALKQFETAIQQAQSAYNTLLANANAAASQIDQASDALNQAKANFQNRLDQLLATSSNEISIVNIIAYQPGKVPFSLNKVPGGNHYTLQGSGTFGLKQYLKDRIKLNYFAVSTDGNFAFIAPVNFKQDFLGLAEFEINEFGLNTIKKSLTVGGKLYLKIPGFGIGAGAVITYYQGGRAELSGISFKMDVGPVGTFAGGLTIKDNGFSGMGQLKIAGAFGIAGSFLYEKQDRGFRFGVSFEVQPNPIIPVGIVAIGVKGGGFEINTNPGRESVAISVKGSLSLLVDPTATLGINPLEVKITVGAGGPILEGKGTIVAATIPLGEGGFKIDIPNRYFTAYLELGKSLNLIPSAPLQAEAGARISASFQSGNQYFMLAMYNYLNIANIVKSKTNIAFAWGLRKNQGTDEDKYVAFIPDNYLQNGKLFGFGFSTSTEFGIPRERAIKFEIPLIVSASGYYYNRSGVEFYGNFKTSTYGFALESRFEAGAELKIIKIISIGGGLNIAGRIAGGYGQGNWFFEASLSAGIYGYINCETDCRNEICTAFFIPVGFTVCVNGKVQMSLSSQNGFRSSISLN